MATNIDKFLEPSELGIAGNVPIGGIILWQNPDPASVNPSPPTSYEFCDGTAVTTPGPMNGQTKANLMVTAAGGVKGMVRGANVTGAAYGDGTALVVGGADTHQHNGGTTSSDGSHPHTVNSHNHSISSDGVHAHTLLGPTSGKITFNPATPTGPNDITNMQGSHSHTGFTGNASPSTNSAGNHQHSFNTTAASTLPRYIELAYIVRVA